MIVLAYGVMEFSEKLEKMIAEKGITQTALARETGIDQSAISAMTLGKRRPYMDQALLLARALGVPLDYLADDSMDEPPPTTELGEVAIAILDLVEALDLDKREALRRLAQPQEDPTPRSDGPNRVKRGG
jgi:transcriptional regulator with XRE-family HTH domain